MASGHFVLISEWRLWTCLQVLLYWPLAVTMPPRKVCPQCNAAVLVRQKEHEFACGVLCVMIIFLHHCAVHFWTFAKTFSVWLDSSLTLQAVFLCVNVRDTSNCDIIEHNSSLSHFSLPPPLFFPLYFVYSSLQLTYSFLKPLLYYRSLMRRSFELNAKTYDTGICNSVLYHFHYPAFLL